MMRWIRLDMRRKDSMPPIGALVALRLAPNNGRATFYREGGYDMLGGMGAGALITQPGSGSTTTSGGATFPSSTGS